MSSDRRPVVPESVNPDELMFSTAFRKIVAEERQKGFTRNPKGDIVWRIPGGTYEQNAARAIANIQLALISGIDEVARNFDETGSLRSFVSPDVVSRAIAQLLTRDKFGSIIPTTATNALSAPIFEGSRIVLVVRTLTAWGLPIANEDLQMKQLFGRKDRVFRGWTEQNVMEAVQSFYHESGEITQNSLKAHGRYDLISAIQRKIPGGFTELRERLGILQLRVPDGYWTDETILLKAKELVKEYGDIDTPLLRSRGETAMLGAIMNHYPDAMFGLRRDLGFSGKTKQRGYWGLENIRENARKVYTEHGYLTYPLMSRLGLNSLAIRISKNFPGGIEALREEIKGNLAKVNIDEVFGEFFEEEQNG